MAEHKRLQDELAALSAQGRFRGSASRKKVHPLAETLKECIATFSMRSFRIFI